MYMNARSGQGTSHHFCPSFLFKKEGCSNCIHFSTQKSPEYPLVRASCGSVDQGGPNHGENLGGHTGCRTNASGAHLIASPASLPSLLVLLRQSSEGWTADPWPDPSIPMMVILSQSQFESELFTLVTLRSLRPFDITSENKHSSS